MANSNNGGVGGGINLFTVTAEPTFLQAVYNPIYLAFNKIPYTIGQLFFVEIWLVPGTDVRTSGVSKTGATLLRTLRVNGDGTGNCRVDLSSALQTVFRADTITAPVTDQTWQKDNASVAYFVKAGTITFDAQNREVKTGKYESGVKYVVRAALPRAEGGDMSRYQYQFDGETVRFLTNLPDWVKRKPTEHTLLSFFMALPPDLAGRGDGAGGGDPTQIDLRRTLTVCADIQYNDGSFDQAYVLESHKLTSGGVYLVDVRPERLVSLPRYAAIQSYAVYLTYTDDEQVSNIVTETREFLIGDDIQEPVTVKFMNRLGSWDSIQFRRDRLTEIKTKVNNFTNGYGTRVYQIDTATSITYNSGWLTAAEHQWLKDLMVSPALYINDEYHRQADTTYKIDSALGLFTIELTVAPDTEENTIQL